jgi:predicted RNA-binding protein YlxR (DUF448 family)
MMKTIRSGFTKNRPQRTCVSCRKIAGKHELIRLVRTTDGSVEVDREGRKPGRGAYLCPVWDCWKTGIESGRLERSLHIMLTRDNREHLLRTAGDIFSPAVA